ncbi:MAG: NAD(P)H-hydrate epimerase [Phycisphaeraceae bacterium]|nr:NAD(P)H-hydrate epimerase [Phycisphaeraceae bacterium]
MSRPGQLSATGARSRASSCRVLTREDCRNIDRLASEQYGIPSIVLMENAARSIADACMERLAPCGANPTVLVFAGSGNNGGDGFAAARHLTNRGCRVGVILAVSIDRVRGDALTNLTISQRLRIPLATFHPDRPVRVWDELPDAFAKPDLVLDAMLGTGFTGPIRSETQTLLAMCNAMRRQSAAVVSVDLPSGLDADTGVASRDCVIADLTVSLVGLKRGMLTPVGRAACGEIIIGDIGVPTELIQKFGTPLDFDHAASDSGHRDASNMPCGPARVCLDSSRCHLSRANATQSSADKSCTSGGDNPWR